jgi:anaerobic selenocysteine-containing dehydrogenase
MCGGTVQRALSKARKVIVVDPRQIRPAEKVNHWLQLRPGTDGALALAMIHTIIAENLFDREFVGNYTVGFEKLEEHVRPFTPEWAASITRVSPEEICSAARTYATTKPACIQWGNALDMSASSLQTARALLILRGITGNIDRPGSDVLWVPPKGIRQKSIFTNPEQLGEKFLPPDKRRVSSGVFALDLITHPPSFWKSVVTGVPYKPRALWIVGSNPLVTGTDSLVIEEALKHHLEFTVVSDFFLTPTAQLADLVLPAATWLEQDDIVNLHKIWCVLARKKVAQVGEARDDREVILELAKRLGMTEAFPWPDYRGYLNWLLGESGMDFDFFCERGIVQGEMHYEKYREKGFTTPSGKFELYSGALEAMGLSPLPIYREPALSPAGSPELSQQYPLILTTGAKSRFFFHSEGRQIPSLRRRNPDPIVEVHPQTAAVLNIKDGDRVWIETPEGRVEMRARLFDGIADDVISAQHGWWFPEMAPPEHGWKRSSVSLLFGERAGYDPETGSECLRSTICRIYPIKRKNAVETWVVKRKEHERS